MSYDFYVVPGSAGEEPEYTDPFFDDQHPALGSDGMAGTAMMTATGYARCGNYTSNVSPMWTRCLTAALASVPDARQFCGADAKSFNAAGRTLSRRQADGSWSTGPMPVDEDQLRLRDLAGLNCAAIAPVLRAAVEWGVENLDELREMNPENGWGNAEGAVTYLWDIQRMCEAHPKADLRLSS